MLAGLTSHRHAWRALKDKTTVEEVTLYTGIVQGTFPLVQLTKLAGLSQLRVALPAQLLTDLEIGASVGLDGVCMTVTAIEAAGVCFDAMAETLNLTTLGDLCEGQLLNVERSAKQGAEIGGHLISGHVDGKAPLVRRELTENNLSLFFQLPEHLRKYVFHKGFIGLHGCSLTVASVDQDGVFCVCLIPETRRMTNLEALPLGGYVNIEVDRQTQVIVDTVERVLAQRAAQGQE